MSFSIASLFVNNSFVSFKLYHEIQVNKMINNDIENLKFWNQKREKEIQWLSDNVLKLRKLINE